VDTRECVQRGARVSWKRIGQSRQHVDWMGEVSRHKADWGEGSNEGGIKSTQLDGSCDVPDLRVPKKMDVNPSDGGLELPVWLNVNK
jgi:hypothetical protein